VYLIIENIVHNNSIKSIPSRIHVNGTRGKSSVAILIAAGVRAGGYRTVAKTTGTLARSIDVDGSETPVCRIGVSNIAEQVKIMFKA
ncbi:poly-gamma-glutamate synthase PgsB, partial [Francisella tularensis subsp. holarctica]|nr:poly-gamma-glutamate synthase PgsB [Francisella tularensis subsp. holarctica]